MIGLGSDKYEVVVTITIKCIPKCNHKIILAQGLDFLKIGFVTGVPYLM